MMPNEDCPLCKERWVDTVADVILEKERIIEFLRSCADNSARAAASYRSSLKQDAEAEDRILRFVADAIADGSWVALLGEQQAQRRRASLRVIR